MVVPDRCCSTIGRQSLGGGPGHNTDGPRPADGCLDDVFQTVGGAVTRLSQSPWDFTPQYCSSGGGGYYAAYFAGASDDATTVCWTTTERLDGDTQLDVFRSDHGGAPTHATPGTDGFRAEYRWSTPDGGHMFFSTAAPVLDDGDTVTDIFQNSDGTISKVSTGPEGGDGAFAAG